MKKISVILFLMCSVNDVFANDLITSNVVEGCIIKNSAQAAIFEPNEHTCDAGYYLPINTDNCTLCLLGHTCIGGTYAFNETINQGIKYTMPIIENVTNGCNVEWLSNPTMLVAQFEPNEYTCDIGYYLPADSIECVMCPVDSYCPGGTYAFNETLTQGIVSCGTGLFAPAGMWESAQCGRILHAGDGVVYLRSTKKTEHALCLDLNHDGVADYFGNMTTLDVPMSRETQRKLKVRMNGVVYSIYDDSVDLSLYE